VRETKIFKSLDCNQAIQAHCRYRLSGSETERDKRWRTVENFKEFGGGGHKKVKGEQGKHGEGRY
jgi:hypothetical protein